MPEHPKGHTFTADDLPKRVRSRMTAEQRIAWCERQTARFAIVGEGLDGPVIAEDEQGIFVQSFHDPATRRLVGALLVAERKNRQEVLAAFDTMGNPKYPWRQ